jgi:hypothetical protein
MTSEKGKKAASSAVKNGSVEHFVNVQANSLTTLDTSTWHNLSKLITKMTNKKNYSPRSLDKINSLHWFWQSSIQAIIHKEIRLDALWICQVLADSLKNDVQSDMMEYIVQLPGFIDAIFLALSQAQVNQDESSNATASTINRSITSTNNKIINHSFSLLSNLMVKVTTCEMIAQDQRLVPAALLYLTNPPSMFGEDDSEDGILYATIHILLAASRPIHNRILLIQSPLFIQTFWNFMQILVASYEGEVIDFTTTETENPSSSSSSEGGETDNNDNDESGSFEIPPQVTEFQDELLWTTLCVLHNLSKHPDISTQLVEAFHLAKWCCIVMDRSAVADNVIIARRILENVGLETDFKVTFSFGEPGNPEIAALIVSWDVHNTVF